MIQAPESSFTSDVDPQPKSLAPAQPIQHKLHIAFTGSGSEYFRIWIVNLLLTLVTIGLYYPWAKVRRLRYFYGNTLVEGAALDFHGNPKKMLRGTLLVALLFGMYSVAGYFSNTTSLAALVLLVAVMPALLRASLQFRLAHTSWRGLRFHFNGNVVDAYQAMLPMYLPSVLIVGLITVTPGLEEGKEPSWFWWAFLSIAALTALISPWSFAKFKQYQHNHYRFAHLQTRLTTTPGSFYKLSLKIIGMVFLVLIFALVLILVGAFIVSFKPKVDLRAVTRAWLDFLPIVAALSAMVFVQPYAIARTQNLVWNHTGNQDLQFQSDLRFKPMFWLTLKNWLLVLLTLGFYWPFAAVAIARIRLEAASIVTHIDPDTLLGQPAGSGSAAVGDAAGDILGIDFGL
ncbi:Uncharacterized membrane protein YjgN, DUF898 family [Rhodoferax sp. OV413]|uniref:YjgN family protein n=1 Tax=Rhodoferax sp. OV413 TaxID=1855285 RepID=UPI00088331B1|nr:YjgN family protein [Rhodoferax sp. OV413]SDP82431.1 Uncharacterized membrane protein YjgN, DUF898 family [Rhodoferax sp. OV413]